METTINLDRVRPERVAGYGTNFVGEGWVERAKGTLPHKWTLRGTVTLDDAFAQKAMDSMLDGHTYPFTFTDVKRLIGVELVEGQLASSLSQ